MVGLRGFYNNSDRCYVVGRQADFHEVISAVDDWYADTEPGRQE